MGLHPLRPRPAWAFQLSKGTYLCPRASSDPMSSSFLPCTNVPQCPADPPPPPRVWGRSVLPMPTSSPPHICLGLLEAQLAANRLSEHPPAPPERPAQPEPSRRGSGSDPWPGVGSPGEQPTMHRTSERERTLGPQGHRALRPGRTARSNTARSQEVRGRTARGRPSIFTLVPWEEPAV